MCACGIKKYAALFFGSNTNKDHLLYESAEEALDIICFVWKVDFAIYDRCIAACAVIIKLLRKHYYQTLVMISQLQSTRARSDSYY